MTKIHIQGQSKNRLHQDIINKTIPTLCGETAKSANAFIGEVTCEKCKAEFERRVQARQADLAGEAT